MIGGLAGNTRKRGLFDAAKTGITTHTRKLSRKMPPHNHVNHPTDVSIEVSTGQSSDDMPAEELHPPSGNYIGSWRWKVFQTFENPGFSRLAKAISLLVMVTILVSTLTFILESEACEPTSFLPAAPTLEVFLVIEVFSVVVFSIEYLCRFACCPRQFTFFVTPLNLIDLLAILPFYLTVALRQGLPNAYECRDDYNEDGQWVNVTLWVNGTNGEDQGGIPNLGFLRVVRLVRIFRVFKFGRYSLGLQMFVGCLKSSTQPLGILAVITVIATTVFGAIINIFEATNSSYSDPKMYLNILGKSPEEHDLCFGTIIRGYWWAFVTMTTVGYGDCFPVTPVGKLITGIAMICGILSLALPITVIGSNFAKMVEVFAEEAAELGKADLDGTGAIDEMELRTFIAAKKKEGVLAPGVDTNVARLMSKYSAGDKGFLDTMEFARLQEDIISPQDKAMGTLEQVGISVAFQEENARRSSVLLQSLRADLDGLAAKQDKRLDAIERMLATLVAQSGGGGGGENAGRASAAAKKIVTPRDTPDG